MSVRVLTWAFEQNLAPNEKVVLLALADTADDEGYCWPGRQYLARKASVSERTLTRIIASLVEKGLIEISRRYSDNTGLRTSDAYRLMRGSDANLASKSHAKSGQGYTPTVASTKEPSVEPSITPHSPPRGAVKKEAENDAVAEAFEDVWKQWPKKVRKQPAVRAFRKAWSKVGIRLLTDIPRFGKAYAARPADQIQYVPDLSTWLNEERWDEQLPAIVYPTQKSGRQLPPPTPRDGIGY